MAVPATAAAGPPVLESDWVTFQPGKAILHAVINPNGTEASYQFEWGTGDKSEEQGDYQSVPAEPESLGAGEEGVAVEQSVDVLPLTTYHYRIFLLTPYGPLFSQDKTFSTPPDAPPVNTSAPFLSGAPAVGEELSCALGAWENEPTEYTYAWLRDTDPILGEAGPSYIVNAGDQGHSLACEVTAKNDVGFASMLSNSLAIPNSPSDGVNSPSMPQVGSAAPLQDQIAPRPKPKHDRCPQRVHTRRTLRGGYKSRVENRHEARGAPQGCRKVRRRGSPFADYSTQARADRSSTSRRSLPIKEGRRAHSFKTPDSEKPA
jgi:hypothetical protein